MKLKINKFSLTIIMMILMSSLKSYGQAPEILDAAEIQIALAKLNVLGSVLYVAAHPDDENTAALAYFSKERKYRTAYLSLTRGDGGQNLIGPEKGAEIGIIRTQELVAARSIDKAEQWFARTIDFGYSKTADESFEFWGREEALSDMVWIIRKFKPDVIMTRFPADRYGGHGHHTASGILSVDAFHAAADPNRFPDQLEYVKPWKAKRLYWNIWRPGEDEIPSLQRIDVGKYNPLLGQSYAEIAAISRSMHKSQGFGATGSRGTRYEYFKLMEGEPAVNDVFDGINTSWSRIPGGDNVSVLLDDVIESFESQNPSKSISGLLNVYETMSGLVESDRVIQKMKECKQLIQSCAGLWMEAIADDFSAAPGDEINITTTFVNRSDFPISVEKIRFSELGDVSLTKLKLDNNVPRSKETSIKIPEDHPISQPYWLTEPSTQGLFTTRDQQLIGLAESPPAVTVWVTVDMNGQMLDYQLPLIYRWRDRVDGERYRLFEVRPPVTLELDDGIRLFTDNHPKEIKVLVKSHSDKVEGVLRLHDEGKWQTDPENIPFTMTKKYEEKQFSFKVIPPQNPAVTHLTAEAEIEGKRINRSLVEIAHPHIKQQVYFPESNIKVVKFDLEKNGQNLGYIMGSGDEVVDGLTSLGYSVTMLNDDMLSESDLSQFDAIISGIRAYNTRDRLMHTHPRLLQYVNNGGTLIVQYNVSRGLQLTDIGPYSFTIGRDRVSDETAEVKILKPDHALFNWPNKITEKDFEGWVQERGLYFATEWSDQYEALLSAHDPGESDKMGGLLYTEYGKGIFIYTGFSWFRQLPAGVPGAFRLFVNLISTGK